MASRAAPRLLSSSQRLAIPRLADTTTTTPTLLARSRTRSAAAQHARALRPRLAQQLRFQHAIPRFTGRNPFSANPSPQGGAGPEAPDAETAGQQQQQQQTRTQSQPHYQLTFTCVPCGARSKHAVSKQGYHHGSVLITCPDCRNRHVISDHLGIFGDRKGVTVEQLMREKGLLVKKGTLGEDGNIEFWEDDLPDGAKP